jgi:hypothetical protein
MAILDVREQDWLRISNWCLLGALVMTVWLMKPVAQCSYRSFRDTPLDATRPDDPAYADKDRVDQGKSFFEKVVDSTKTCYRRTPLLGQEPWKGNVLIGLVGIMVLARVIRRVQAHVRKRRLD